MLILSGDISLNPGPVYNSRPSCSNEWNVFKEKGNIENIFAEILLPKTKLLIVGIIYRPPNQSNFLEIIKANFDKLESYIFGSLI